MADGDTRPVSVITTSTTVLSSELDVAFENLYPGEGLRLARVRRHTDAPPSPPPHPPTPFTHPVRSGDGPGKSPTSAVFR